MVTINSPQVYSSAFVVPSAAGGAECDNVEVPKALGDMLEALIGAIYVDSDLQVERVWQVLLPLMENAISE